MPNAVRTAFTDTGSAVVFDVIGLICRLRFVRLIFPVYEFELTGTWFRDRYIYRRQIEDYYRLDPVTESLAFLFFFESFSLFLFF